MAVVRSYEKRSKLCMNTTFYHGNNPNQDILYYLVVSARSCCTFEHDWFCLWWSSLLQTIWWIREGSVEIVIKTEYCNSFVKLTGQSCYIHELLFIFMLRTSDSLFHWRHILSVHSLVNVKNSFPRYTDFCSAYMIRDISMAFLWTTVISEEIYYQ